jgi:hypothetical protein
MGFTNDCYPGCACDRDFFDMTPARVHLWFKTVGKAEGEKARAQTEQLINCSSLNLEGISAQTNYYFDNHSEAIAWLLEWKLLLTKAISSSDQFSVNHTSQKKR